MIIYTVIVIVFISFLLRSARNILYQAFLWQIKEYRYDRIFAHLKTAVGRRLIFGKFTLLKWLLLLGFTAVVITSRVFIRPSAVLAICLIILYLAFWGLWIIEAIVNVYEFITRGWRTPILTVKMAAILSVPVFFYILIIMESDMLQVLLIGPILDKIIAPLVFFCVLLINIPASVVNKIIIYLAKRKIRMMENLTVIGVTGSYGKTSTKEYIAALLSNKYQIAKTPGKNNTEIGVAWTIINTLKPSHRVFVVEMGAYKKGEIDKIAKMVRPVIAVITSIGNQHLELFGSLENLIQAKTEVITNLTKDGVLVINENNINTKKIMNWAKSDGIKIDSYNIEQEIKNIKVFKNRIECLYRDKEMTLPVKVDLIGEQNLENLLAAFHVGRLMNVSKKELAEGMKNIIPPDQTMTAHSKNRLTLIDDSFNANPEGVKAALKYMKLYKGKKILVLTPLIELGEESNSVHRDLGRLAGYICDKVYLTNINFHQAFLQGVEKSSSKTQVRVAFADNVIEYLRAEITADSVVVCEGKESAPVVQWFLRSDNV